MPGLPLHETEMIKRWVNHAEFSQRLRELGLVSDLRLHNDQVVEVALAWFRLGRDHLTDAKNSLVAGSARSAYSRAYYAAYNMSKAVRFLVTGFVSLRGDDHKAVGRLPKDFPNVSTFSRDLEVLYEHRLRADYENWSNTQSQYTLTPSDAVSVADRFHVVATSYLSSRLGFTP